MLPAGEPGPAANDDLRARRPADVDDVTVLRHEVTAWVRAHQLAGDLADDVELSTYEALINTAKRAYPDDSAGIVDLHAHHQSDLVRITVTDHGP
ncbi:ATP-binding protein [Amycolatopsis sp. NPDC051372]|uniref:ATP-binding protein n=1 Tax=unclassified Amycolatopsis TaxID=2618356 RepID=UPI00343B6B07